MARFLIILTGVILIACNTQVNQYKQIIDQVNGVEIHYLNSGKVIEVPVQQVQYFKEVVLRNIKPEAQRDVHEDTRVNFLKNKDTIAHFVIYQGTNEPFVNFYSDNLNFGFRLTYGIGMFLSESYQ
jgi:hypothetical protein